MKGVQNQFDFNLEDKIANKYQIKSNIITKNHSFQYNENNYFISYKIKEYYKKSLYLYKKRIFDYNYLLNIIKCEAIKKTN